MQRLGSILMFSLISPLEADTTEVTRMQDEQKDQVDQPETIHAMFPFQEMTQQQFYDLLVIYLSEGAVVSFHHQSEE